MTQPPGLGIVSQTIQFHGTADRYTLERRDARSRRSIRTRPRATPNPAVTSTIGRPERRPGGGVHVRPRPLGRAIRGRATRPGPARSATACSADPPGRPLLRRARGDVQPDWVDTTKIAIPQADEQQRLLVNLITQMDARPAAAPALLVPAARKEGGGRDDAATTTRSAEPAGRLRPLQGAQPRRAAPSSTGSACARRPTSIPDSPLTNAQAAGYAADGFEVALHPSDGGCDANTRRRPSLAVSTRSCAQFAARYTSVAAPVSSRTHCVAWPDWACRARRSSSRTGSGCDGNYYHYPGAGSATSPAS